MPDEHMADFNPLVSAPTPVPEEHEYSVTTPTLKTDFE